MFDIRSSPREQGSIVHRQLTPVRGKFPWRSAVALAGIVGLAGAASLPRATAQVPSQVTASTSPQVQSTLPVREARYVSGYSFPEGLTVGIRLLSTARLPGATGEAKVERKRGTTEIEVELDEMKPATEFGGDFSTYVLWTVSPEGQVDNAGEFILQGNRSKLNVATPLQSFGMIVSAEPHYLVPTPSTFIVLQAVGFVSDNISSEVVRTSTLEYRGYEGVYNYYRRSLEFIDEADGEQRSDVKQARMAVDLAIRAGAETYAEEELRAAQAKLSELFGAAERNSGTHAVTSLAHDVVRMGLDAQMKAEDRAFQSALDAERKRHAEQVRQRDAEIRNAESEATRAQLEAANTEQQLAMERRAREAARSDAAAEARRAAAAEAKAEQARRAQSVALARMNRALGVVADTRESARGLIVNLPDILFEFDQAALKPEARETLGKVCGILLVAPGQELEIEGHTDSIGEPVYNQALSEQRAQSVHSYLRECGLKPEQMNWQGFGEDWPIATNDNEAGRLQNRRVEIVIEN